MPHSSVELSRDQAALIDRLIESGRFSDASEVLSAGLRLLDDRESERQNLMAELEAAIQEGIDSGEPLEMEPMDEIIARAEKEIAERRR
jgi:putative addiction module CopG family antidote